MEKKFSEKETDLEHLNSEVDYTLEKLGINPVDWQRRISVSDVLYLIDHCPFLQMVDTGGVGSAPAKSLQLMTARSGWKIQDFGDALSSSPGELLFGGGDFRITLPDEDKGGGIINPGKGTIVNQAVVTAFEMVELAQKHAWAGIKIVDGHPLMLWAAWMQAQDYGIPLEGFTPTEHDQAKRRRIKRSRTAEQTLLYKPPTP